MERGGCNEDKSNVNGPFSLILVYGIKQCHKPFKNHRHIPIYIQQDATLHSLFHLETALHVSGGTSTHHQERIQLYLQHLVFVTPLLRTILPRQRWVAVTV